MNTNTYSAALFRKTQTTSQGPRKFRTAGVKTNVKLKDIVVDDRYVKFVFESVDGMEYADKTIWLNPFNAFTTQEEKDKFENKIMNSIISVLDIMAPFEEVDQLSASSLSGYALKAKELASKYSENARFNIGVIYDKKGDFTEIPEGYGIIEKYVEGQSPRIDLTYYASRLTKSATATQAIANAVSDTAPRPNDMPF